MTFNKDVIEAIGNTPLIKLKRASELTGCTILGKAEFMNPGQSVKDRAGKWMILEAEKRGDLKPGGLVVESTAGNTGIGLAVVANARGYRTLIVIPETQSQEKKDMLRLCGAELVEVPALPYSNPNNYQHVGRRLADQLRKTEPNGVLFADQWNNLDNAKAHYESTGPEIWEQTGGKIDGFICSVGTGGTLAGTSRYPEGKEQGHRRRLRRSARLCDVRTVQERRRQIDAGRLDHRRHRAWPRHARDRDRQGRRRLPRSRTRKPCRSSTTCSSTRACASAARPASMSPARSGSPSSSAPARPSSRSSADSGNRYQSKLFNPEFMRSKNLPVPDMAGEAQQDRRAVREGVRLGSDMANSE